ncbi:MAG: hypothetical protein GKC10_04070 [Methanosarcinales archaeon]|nr:hypothetical protein [Methanosarcinales archaeon]
MLLISLILLPICGCVDENDEAVTASVPTDNLPQGFTLLAVMDKNTKNVNITEEIKDFYGSRDIGQVNATVGKYQWAPLGQAFDARITLIETQSPEIATAAAENYRALEEYQRPPALGVDRFSTAIVNGHEVTEIRDRTQDTMRYLFLWTNENLVILVEGTDDRSQSLELASVTGF